MLSQVQNIPEAAFHPHLTKFNPLLQGNNYDRRAQQDPNHDIVDLKPKLGEESGLLWRSEGIAAMPACMRGAHVRRQLKQVNSQERT